MLRRKARDHSDILESGYGLNSSSGIPMKKLPSMRKFIQLCVLVILLIALHAMYRVMFQTNVKNVDVQNTDNDLEKLEKSVKSFDMNIEREQKQDIIKEEIIDVKKEINDIDSKDDHIKFDENIKRFDSTVKGDKKDIVIEEGIDHLLEDSQKTIDDETKDKANDMKLHPNDPVVKEELERKMNIELKIADKVKDFKDEDNIQVEEKRNEMEPNIDNFVKKVEKFNAQQNEFEETKQDGQKFEVLEVIDHHSHKLLPMVTASSQDTYKATEQLVESFQSFHPKETIYIYDLDLTDDQRKRLASFCGVQMRSFWKSIYPEYVRNTKKKHWRITIIQVALSQHGHLIWIDPGWVLRGSMEELIHKSEEAGVFIIGRWEPFSTYAVTHPHMYKFIPTDEEKLKRIPHITIRAMFIHRETRVMKHFLNILMACVLEQACIEPPGASDQCDFEITGRVYANCHKEDSAINIVFKNWYNFHIDNYAKKTNFLDKARDNYMPAPKKCRN